MVKSIDKVSKNKKYPIKNRIKEKYLCFTKKLNIEIIYLIIQAPKKRFFCRNTFYLKS